MSGIAITDHETMEGAVRLSELNTDENFKIIIGIEIKTERGDIIGLFLQDEIKSRFCFEVINEIKLQGGVVVLPHPFKKTTKLSPELISSVDAIEVFNSRLTNRQNQKAFELAQINNKAMIGGSDAHLISDIGRTATLFKDFSRIKDDLLAGNCQVDGSLSSEYVHYLSAVIGNYSRGTLLKTMIKKILG